MKVWQTINNSSHLLKNVPIERTLHISNPSPPCLHKLPKVHEPYSRWYLTSLPVRTTSKTPRQPSLHPKLHHICPQRRGPLSDSAILSSDVVSIFPKILKKAILKHLNPLFLESHIPPEDISDFLSLLDIYWSFNTSLLSQRCIVSVSWSHSSPPQFLRISMFRTWKQAAKWLIFSISASPSKMSPMNLKCLGRPPPLTL
mgnify:CR=1 FL=1